MEFKEIKISDEKLIKRIVEIEEEVFGVNGGADFWLVKAFVRYGLLFVLIDGDEIISIAEYMQVFGKKELFLYGFSTRINYRNKGYGKKLVQESEKKAREKGIGKISLTVDPKNEIGVSMYKKLGYIIEEFQKDEYGEGIDRYLMSKKLI